jgi:hypothetical protein
MSVSVEYTRSRSRSFILGTNKSTKNAARCAYRRPSPADAGDHGGAWLLPFPVWLQLGVRAALRSFLVDLFVPKIKLRATERERVCERFYYAHDSH